MAVRKARGSNTRKLRPLKSSASFTSFVLDQLADLGDVTARAMFGGVGLYCDGLFFGLIARDEVYLKVDDSNRGDFEGVGSRPFKPYADRAGTMQYYAVPVAILESSLELAAWARKSVLVAAKAGSRPRSR